MNFTKFCCEIQISDIIPIISAFTTGAVAAMGSFIAVRLDYYRAKRKQKYQIHKKRNFLRIKILLYLINYKKILIEANSNGTNPNVPSQFFETLLDHFNSCFLPKALLESEKTYKKISLFLCKIESLYNGTEENTFKKLMQIIDELIGYLQNILKRTRRSHNV